MTAKKLESKLDFISRRRRRAANVCNTCMYCSPVGCQPGGPDQVGIDPDAFECRYHPPAAVAPRRPRVELLDWCQRHPMNQALERYRVSRHLDTLSGGDK